VVRGAGGDQGGTGMIGHREQDRAESDGVVVVVSSRLDEYRRRHWPDLDCPPARRAAGAMVGRMVDEMSRYWATEATEATMDTGMDAGMVSGMAAAGAGAGEESRQRGTLPEPNPNLGEAAAGEGEKAGWPDVSQTRYPEYYRAVFELLAGENQPESAVELHEMAKRAAGNWGPPTVSTLDHFARAKGIALPKMPARRRMELAADSAARRRAAAAGSVVAAGAGEESRQRGTLPEPNQGEAGATAEVEAMKVEVARLRHQLCQAESTAEEMLAAMRGQRDALAEEYAEYRKLTRASAERRVSVESVPSLPWIEPLIWVAFRLGDGALPEQEELEKAADVLDRVDQALGRAAAAREFVDAMIGGGEAAGDVLEGQGEGGDEGWEVAR
jgi:hypothetical protein